MRVQYKECDWNNLEHNGKGGVFWVVHRKDVGFVVAKIPIWLINSFIDHPEKVLQHFGGWQVL